MEWAEEMMAKGIEQVFSIGVGHLGHDFRSNGVWGSLGGAAGEAGNIDARGALVDAEAKVGDHRQEVIENIRLDSLVDDKTCVFGKGVDL